MKKQDGLRLLPLRENHNCFGCSQKNESGLRMRFHTDGKALYSWLDVPSHLSGWEDIVHGGVVTTMLDEVMGWSAIYLLRCLVLTKSISVDFLRPVRVEKPIRVEGRVAVIRSEREAVMEGKLYDEEENLCSRAKGVFALFQPEAAKKMGLMDENLLKDLDSFVSS